ncbi:MAG: hypothetical protein U5J63_04755 [Fodinibius sp.]|nr:hypothetical protein [Fodinibius sp.]
MKSMYQFLTLSLLFVLASVFAISCGNSAQENTTSGQQLQSYPVLELQPRSIELTSSYPATLEGRQTVEIRPRLQGYITKCLLMRAISSKKANCFSR